MAPWMPPDASYPATVSALPRRRRQVSSRACDTSGSIPACPVASAMILASSGPSTVHPACTAGLMIACGSSSLLIGPTATCASANARASPVCAAQRW